MIKSTLARLLLITTGLLLPQIASAEDDLLLYVFQSGQPQRSATITIDGEVAGSTRLDGSLTADLTAGGHVIAVDAGGEQRVVRFSLESGQLADIVIELAPGVSPLIDVYGSRESAAERRDQPKGSLEVTVTRDGAPVIGTVVNLSNGGGRAVSDEEGVATIEAGVEVKGLEASDGTFQTAAVLQINRGAKIEAVGTATAPIIFSSEDADYDNPFEWGGLVISGFGRHNTCTADLCNITAEGGAGNFGQINGDTRNDSSGTLKYVVVAEVGYLINADVDEINGLSLNGVGSGTENSYLQVHDNADDGIEFYGGDVKVKYAVVTAARYDSVDWDEGYRGNMQYVIVKQSPEGSGEAFEMDTQGADEPLSKPTIANVTIIADKQANDDSFIMQFKKKSGGFFHNVVATVAGDSPNTFASCARITGGARANVNTALVFNNWIQDCANNGSGGDLVSADSEAGADALGNSTIVITAPALDAILASQAPEAVLAAPVNWTDINGTFAESTANTSFLDATDFIGAVNPDGSNPWWAGWTLPGTL